MARILRATLPGLMAALLLSVSVSADIYRWTDGEGREHFTMDLHSVPPEHRAEADRRSVLEKARVDPGPDAVNTMKTPDSSKMKRALRRRRRSYSRSPAASADVHCSASHRQTAQKLARDVAKWEKKVELEEELARRLVLTDDRLHAENRAERYQIYLEQAEQAQEDFEDRMRQKDVPPGCYR